MAIAFAAFGIATVSSTAAGPGTKPSATVTSTGNFTATNGIFITPIQGVDDSRGTIRLEWSRTSNDVISVKANRQLPAGKSIGFWWLSTSQ